MNDFCISRTENVKENIERILLEQIDYILMHCEGGQKDIHKSIHEIRKSIKRIRAVLRLIREEIGYSSYYRENVFYRDLNRRLSDLRNLNVLILNLERLKKDLSVTIPGEKLDPLIGFLLGKRDKMVAGKILQDDFLSKLAGKILNARKRISELPISNNSFEAFAGGMYRMYRQGKDYLITAGKDPDPHLLHDMRKRMKYLWYQIEILKPMYPGLLKAFAGSLENITEKLGIYHDFDVLSEYLHDPDIELDAGIQEALLEACEFKKSALLKEILRKAGALFSEEPEALIHRMEQYWNFYHFQKS